MNATRYRPSRRALMRLGAGAALTGLAGAVLGTRRASAQTCRDDCLNWLSRCADWCDAHDPTESCYEACRSNAGECIDCCAAGGSPGECVPPEAPVKAALIAYANALFVAAELGYSGSQYGMLRARTGGHAGPWEKLDILTLSNGKFAIRASNGLYVSAELGYARTDPRYGMLRARASKIDIWEQFTLGHVADSTHGSYRLQAFNGLWVAAEVGYAAGNPLYGMLRARTSGNAIGPWEKYSWIEVPR